MGRLHKISISSFDKPQMATGNPDPKRWELVCYEYVHNYLILKLRYPSCTNYEGLKILVFKDICYFDLIQQGSIDPHFSNNKAVHSPIARFEPTEEGMRLAKLLCKIANIASEGL